MKARYALLLSRQYRHVLRENESSRCDLYTFIYPKIYTAIRQGLTNTSFGGGISSGTKDMLTNDGFVVFTNGLNVKIDWSFDEKKPN